MAAQVACIHDTPCISSDYGIAGKHQYAFVVFLSSDKICIFRSFYSSFLAYCYKSPKYLNHQDQL